MYAAPMNRKQVVDRESTHSSTTTRRPAAVVVASPILSGGAFELFRIARAMIRAERYAPRCGVVVNRRSEADPTMICVLPDPRVPAGEVVTEYLR